MLSNNLTKQIRTTYKSNKHLNNYIKWYSNKKLTKVDIPFPSGRNLQISNGQYAYLTNAYAVATIGETEVVATVVSKPSQSTSGFLPLVVDYRQKSEALGFIPLNASRRERGPTDQDILTSRLIDRSLRPLFPENFRFDTQLICSLLSIDEVNNPNVVSINAASAALALSEIPWNGPIGAVCLGLIDNEVVINPTRKELQLSSLNLVVSATKRNLVVMLEGNADSILQQDLMKAIKMGTKETQHIINEIENLQKLCGKPKWKLEPLNQPSEELTEALTSLSQMRIREIFQDYSHDKLSRDNALVSLRTDVLDKIKLDFPSIDLSLVSESYNKIVKNIFRDLIFEIEKRCDGRDYDDLRNIECEVDSLKQKHGSALFTRGQTQVSCVVTFDSPESVLKLDTVTMMTSGVKKKQFFLHYDFPPPATNEIGRVDLVGRREIGHGALAEKGLAPTIPNDFPFTIRLNSHVIASNGSSSMASVCGGCLALMDAGVPITTPAAGVAIGLITRYDNQKENIEDYRLLTDLLGIEDYMGDMDFKIAGTKKGVTALQADVKIPGLPLKIIMEAIEKATEAKKKILNIMRDCIDKPRTEKKDCFPVYEELEVEAHKRGQFLGIGGINLKNLLLETGVQVLHIDGTKYKIFAPNRVKMDEAQEIINKLLSTEKTPELEFGGIYSATIVELRDIGVMVTLYPGMPPALLHNSQLDQRKVAHPSALGLEVGQELKVKYFGRDPVSGLMRISRKVLQTAPTL